jgi:hypothetical protein
VLTITASGTADGGVGRTAAHRSAVFPARLADSTLASAQAHPEEAEMANILDATQVAVAGQSHGVPQPGSRSATCGHVPACPPADRADREAARAVACHPEQGWSLLCNSVVLFDDTGQVLPDGRVVPPRRGSPHRMPAAA